MANSSQNRSGNENPVLKYKELGVGQRLEDLPKNGNPVLN